MGILDLLFPAIQTQESTNNPFAVSPKGAFGLMQLMPDTARDPGFGVKPFNFGTANPAAENQRVGRDYFTALYNKYQGDVPTALMAYNWGPGNVDKWLAGGRQGPVPAETQNYVKKIMANVSGNDTSPTTVADNSLPTPSPGIKPTMLAGMQPELLAGVQDMAPQPSAPAPALTQAIQTGPAPMAKSAPDPTDLTDPTFANGGGILAGLTGGRGLLNLSPTARQMLMAFGGGLAGGATQGWGAGIGAGLQNAQQAYMNRIALDMKMRELALETYKARMAGVKMVPGLEGGQTPISISPDGNTYTQISPAGDNGVPSPMAGASPAPVTPSAPMPITPPAAAPIAPTAPAPASAAPVAPVAPPPPVTPPAPDVTPPTALVPSDVKYNEDAIKQYPPIVQDRARAMAVGDLPIPKTIGTRGNSILANQTMDALLAYTNGHPDTSLYDKKQASILSQNTGPIGKSANAFRALVGHMGEAIQSINDVNNGKSKLANTVGNLYTSEIGGEGTIDAQNKLAQLKENVHTLASEAEQVWEVGGGSEGAMNAWEESFPFNAPRQVQIAAIQKLVDMVRTKAEAIQGQANAGVKGTSSPAIQIITPALDKVLQSYKSIDTSEYKTPNPAQVKLFQQLYSSTPPAHQAEVRKAFESRFGPADRYLAQPGTTTMGM